MSQELEVVKSKLEILNKKDYINVLRNHEPKIGVLFTDFIISTITRKARRMGERYVKSYRTLVYHLNEFQALYGAVIYTNSVTEEFLDDFIVYLQSRNVKQNYIKSLLILSQGMARKAGEYGYAVDLSYDDVILDSEETFSIYLTTNEITRIYFFQGLTKKQERIRDLFVLGCLTGLRYSDYSTLEPCNFVDDNIVKITKKTKKKVIIPMHDYVKDIIDKYDGQMVWGLCNQHFNRYVKEICRKVGLSEMISYQYTRGGKLVTDTKAKWELISSHTARRSAATGMVLSGFNFYEVMAVTGHTTEKSLARYIKITPENVARQMSGNRFFTK